MTSFKEILLIAPCGLNCGICITHLRSKNKCCGCRIDDIHKHISCVNCKIKNCGFFLNKKEKFCFKCKKFPCDKLIRLAKRYRTRYNVSLFENFKYIKNFGIKKFLIKEKHKWACPECGGTISVHKGYCLSCEAENQKMV